MPIITQDVAKGLNRIADSIHEEYKPKGKVTIPLKLIDGMGYDSRELANLFKQQGRLDEWRNFIFGSTGCFSKDKKHMLVYPCDVEAFINKNTDWD